MSENGVAGFFLKEKARLLKQIELFTDIRKNPQIKLTHIVLSVLMMPFFSLHSLLSLDRVSRRNEFKKYFGCARKMVASDSTVSRALHWLKPDQLEQLQRSLLPLFEQQDLSRTQLAPKGPYRRIGILDGSQMAQHQPVPMRPMLKAIASKQRRPRGSSHFFQTPRSIPVYPHIHMLSVSLSPQTPSSSLLLLSLFPSPLSYKIANSAKLGRTPVVSGRSSPGGAGSCAALPAL